MGAPKQKWTAEEEAALKAGINKHGAGKWRTILKDPEFSSVLRYRSNVDLKDKWRNMNVTVNASGSRNDKARTAPTAKKPRSAPKQEGPSTALAAITSDGDDDVADVMPLATGSAKKSLSRLENIILEAVKSLNEPTGSYKTAVSNYIEEQYWPPADFDHVLSAKLNELTATGKLIKVHRKYRIAPSSSFLEGRSSKMLLLEDIQKEPNKVDRAERVERSERVERAERVERSERVERDGLVAQTKSQVDAELARMRNMTAEEAAAAAARAVAEADAIMAEAEAAVREAEAAEADAVAAQAFAEAAMLTLKNRSSAKLIIRG